MSDFWEKNKGGIMKGLQTAGEKTYSGAKTVGKAGYNAARNNGNNKTNSSSDKVGGEQSELSSVRSLSSLKDPTLFPPPPLKPGQNQYTSEKRRGNLTQTQHGQQVQSGHSVQPPVVPVRALPQPSQQSQAQVNHTSIVPPSQHQFQTPAGHLSSQTQPVHQIEPTQVAQSLPPWNQTQQFQPPQVIFQAQPPQAVVQAQPPQAVVQAQPPQAVVQAQPPQAVVQAQPQPPQVITQAQPSQNPPALLDYSNPYYQDAVEVRQQQQQTDISPPLMVPSSSSSPYSRAAIAPPAQIQPVHQTPSPVLSDPPTPARAEIPIIQPQALPIQATTPVQTFDEVPAPVQTFEKVPTPMQAPIHTPARPLSQNLTANSHNLTQPPNTNPTETEEEEEKSINKGISGAYEYHVDVKFAPPPVHRDVTKPGSSKSAFSKSKSVSAHSNPPKPLIANPRPAVGSVAGGPPLPPPRSGSSSFAPTANSPPLLTPTNAKGASPNLAFPPPPRPSQIGHHSTQVQPPQPQGAPVYEDDYENQSENPPAYTSAPGTPVQPSPMPASRPSFDLNQFAPPPKPFNRAAKEHADVALNDSVVEFEHATAVSEQERPSLPPITQVSKLDINDEVTKSKPPPIKPKPSFLTGNPSNTGAPVDKSKPKFIDTPDHTNKSKSPPQIKPKPANLSNTSFNPSSVPHKSKVPPPIKPKPSFISTDVSNKTKPTPPPLTKPKPTFGTAQSFEPNNPGAALESKPNALEMKNTKLGSVISELPSKNVDSVKAVELSHGTTEDDGESGVVYESSEDNPFRRYLKAAVPKEDDRFHRHE